MLIRQARESDVEVLVSLVYDLAAYERLAHECQLTADQLRSALFADNPNVFVDVAEVDGEVVGFALWFLTFSTWTGVNGIYIEDLFVLPDFRSRGVGKALLAALARKAIASGWRRVEWAVLDWNASAIGFYESIGAEPKGDWITYRLSGVPLAKLASV